MLLHINNVLSFLTQAMTSLHGDKTNVHHQVFPIDWMCSLAFIRSDAILEFLGSAEHWYAEGGGHIDPIWGRWGLCPRAGQLRKGADKEGMEEGGGGGGGEELYVPWRGEPPMNPGRDCREVEMLMGEDSQGSSWRPQPSVPEGGWLKERRQEEEVSWSLMEFTSSFSCRRHFARLFWNHTWKIDCR